MNEAVNIPKAKITAVTLPKLWKSKHHIIRFSAGSALLAFVIFLLLPWKSPYEAMVRIEPELSTTGEATSVEAEIDIIKSWGSVSKAVERMNRTVVVKSRIFKPFLHFAYYVDTIKNAITGGVTPDFADYQPSLKLGAFAISGNDTEYLGSKFELEILRNGGYELYAPNGDKLLDGKIGETRSVKLGDSGNQLSIVVEGVVAKAGQSFYIIPQSKNQFIEDLQRDLKVDLKGFREGSGVVTVDYANCDPQFAQQFLQTLIEIYTSQAYGRSSLGKIEGLAKLKEESKALREQLDSERKALNEFKDKNQMMDLDKEQEDIYSRSGDIHQELTRITDRYKDLSVSLTENHPIMIGLRKQMDFLEGELKQLEKELRELPKKEHELSNLQNNIAIAQSTLDQNTQLAAQLQAQVKIITGYARLIALYPYQKLSWGIWGIIAIFLGFIIGLLIPIAQTHKNSIYARYRE